MLWGGTKIHGYAENMGTLAVSPPHNLRYDAACHAHRDTVSSVAPCTTDGGTQRRTARMRQINLLAISWLPFNSWVCPDVLTGLRLALLNHLAVREVLIEIGRQTIAVR